MKTKKKQYIYIFFLLDQSIKNVGKAFFILIMDGVQAEMRVIRFSVQTQLTVCAGGHHADVCGGDHQQARQARLPPGALHRGQVHQVQLQLRLRPGRQHPSHAPGMATCPIPPP